MPQAVPFLVSAAGNSLVAAGYIGATTAWLATIASSVVVGEYLARQSRRDAVDAYNRSLRDRTVMTSTTDRARSRVYGRVRNVDGVLFKATHGEHKKYYTLVVAVAGWPVESVDDVYIGDKLVQLDADGYVTTEPYGRYERVATQALLTFTAGGNGAVALAHAPVPGSVSVHYQDTTYGGGEPASWSLVPHSLAGSTVSIAGQGWLPSGGGTCRVTYQYNKFSSFARIRRYNGGTEASPQDISAELHALCPDLITVGVHRFEGIPLLLCTFEYNTDVYSGGLQSVSAVVRGTRVWDPRTGVTSWYGADSPDDYPAPGENPALCALDWAMFPYGGNLSADEAMIGAFIASANASDVQTNFNTRTRSTLYDAALVGPRYVCAAAISTDAPADRALDDLVLAMAGSYGWTGGRLTVRAGAWRAPVATIDEDWIASYGAVEIQPSTSTQDTVNIIKPTIADATRDFTVSPMPDVRAEPYIEADGQELPLSVQISSISQPVHALDVCEVLLLEGRQALTTSLPCKMHAFQLDEFDVVSVTLPAYGWAVKTFEIVRKSFTMDGGVTLGLREVAASSYDVKTLFTVDDLADNTGLPDPWDVGQVENFEVSSVAALDNDQQVVTRTLATWTQVDRMATQQGGCVELQWASLGLAPAPALWVNGADEAVEWSNAVDALLGWVAERTDELADSDWSSQTEPGTATSSTVVGLRSGYAYLFRARACSKLVRGRWSVMRALVVPTVGTTDAAALAAVTAAAETAAEEAGLAAAAAAAALAGVQDAIDAAQTAADAADAAVAAIASLALDSVLSPVEKMQVIQQYNALLAEQTGIDAQAVDYGVDDEKAAYDAAVSALTSYLATLNSPTAWNNTGGDTAIVGATFRATFVSAYTARQALLNKIAEVAGTRAAWASITGVPYESIYANDDTVALGFNPTFSSWPGTYPDGWANWAGPAPTREETLVRVGRYSVRYSTAGADAGIVAQAAWTASPMGAGAFAAVSFDLRLVARTSGVPGVVVDLFTDAALVGYARTVVTAPSAGVGAWQRVPFSARVPAGQRIYGIRIYLMASNTAFSGGGFTGTAIFDNLRVAFFDQTIDNTSITIGADGTLSGAGGGQVTISGLGYTGDLNATYGASWENFTGRIGAGNLLRYSAFRTDSNSDGLADGWTVYNTQTVTEPVTPSRVEGAGLFGTDAQALTWSVNNTGRKGLTRTAPNGVVGGWEPGATYVVSFYAMATGTNAGQTMSLYWGTAPATTTTLLNPALSSAYQLYAFRIIWGASVQVDGRLWLSLVAAGGTQGTLAVSAVQVAKTQVLTEYMEAVEDVRQAAITAQQAADAAAAQAASALSGIGIVVSDNVLTSLEKRTVILDVTNILAEQTGIDAEASARGLTAEKAAYDGAVSALTAYLATLTAPTAWNSLAGSTTIVGVTFRLKFSNVYAARQALLDAVARKDFDLANAAQSSANAAISSADAATDTAAAAAATAGAAQAAAAAASADIANMSSDNVLTPVEKPALINDYAVITAEQAGIDASASARGISTEKTAYDGKVSALTSYLATLTSPAAWNSLTGNTSVNGSTLRLRFSDVYTSRQALLNKITSKDLDAANAAQDAAGIASAAAAAAQATADSSLSAANAAAAAASAANTSIANMSSDNVLTPVEKPALVQDYSVITGEQAGIDAAATSHGVTTEKTAYDAAVSALTSYLATLTSPVLWSNLTGNTTIVGTTLRSRFGSVYSTRQVLLNSIAEVDRATAQQAIEDAAAAQAQAALAINAATSAAAAANSALASISDMSSDSVLTPVEKPTIIGDYNVIVNEQAGIDAQASVLGISTEKTAYDARVTELKNYLLTLNTPVLWSNLTGNTTIVGTTLRSRFYNVYAARQALLNKIANVASLRADWPNITNVQVDTPDIVVGAVTGQAVFDSGMVLAGISADPAAPDVYTHTDKAWPGVQPTAAYVGNSRPVEFVANGSLWIEVDASSAAAVVMFRMFVLKNGIELATKSGAVTLHAVTKIGENDGTGTVPYALKTAQIGMEISRTIAGYSGSATFTVNIGYILLNSSGATVAPGATGGNRHNSIGGYDMSLSVREFKR